MKNASQRAEGPISLKIRDVPIWPSPIEGIPSFLQCFGRIAVGPDPAIVHRNVVRRRCTKHLPESWSGEVSFGNRLGDGTADHDGVTVPSIKSRDCGWVILGCQSRDSGGVNQRMINREEDELFPTRVLDEVLHPQPERSKHVQIGFWEGQGLQRRRGGSVQFWRKGGHQGRQSTTEHDLGAGLEKGASVGQVCEALGSTEPTSDAPGKNEPRSPKTQEFGAMRYVWVQRFSSILGSISG